MTRIISLVVTLVLLVGTGACFSRGTKVDSDKLAQIKQGETTKNQVLAILGPPNQSFSQDGIETYAYSYTSTQISGKTFIPVAGAFIGGSSGEHQMVAITFDAKGIVESVSTSQGRY
jgi:outer membrane protein assembly factor BamE (lipoprotein component of BamABCDE complex)